MKFAVQNEACQWFDEISLLGMDRFSSVEFDDVCHSGDFDFVIAFDAESDSSLNLALMQQIFSDEKSEKKAKRKGTKKAQYLQHGIDIQGFTKQQQGSFPASKKNLFSQAIGRKTQHVIDATGGWLGDSLLMCSQNYPVTVLERHWLLQGFIKEACHQLSESFWVKENNVPVPELNCLNAIDYLQSSVDISGCVYIDPMFPAKQKKSAAVRKSMQVLHDLVGKDEDSDKLFLAAIESNASRIVVKRPDHASSFDHCFDELLAPTETLRGKLVRYDVYIR